MRRYLVMIEKLYYEFHQKGWFLEAVIVYCDAVKSLVHDIAQIELKSRGLSAFKNYITDYAGSEKFTLLALETKKMKSDLSLIKYCVIIKDNKVNVRRYEQETDYSIEVEKTFKKFKQGAVKDYLSNISIPAGMNHVQANILNLVVKLYPDVFLRLDSYFI